MSRAARMQLGLVLGCVAVLTGCTDGEPGTQVMVVIDAEPGVQGQIHDVQIEVVSGEGPLSAWSVRHSARVGRSGGAVRWPLEVALRPRNGEIERGYRVVASAVDSAGTTLAQVRAISGYVRGRSLRLPLYFDGPCLARDALCEETLTCIDGDCIDAWVDPARLQAFTREPGQPVSLVPPDSDRDAGTDAGTDSGSEPPSCAPGDTSCVGMIDCPASRCGGCEPGFVQATGDTCLPLLTGLGLSAGALSPALNPDDTHYTLTLPLLAQPLWLTPVVAGGVSVRIDSVVLPATGTVAADDIGMGSRTFVIELEHPDHGKRTYQLEVTRSGAEQVYLKASNAGAGDEFGFSVAIDGDTIAVGAPAEDSASAAASDADDESLVDSGAVYVFVRRGDSYEEQARLKADPALEFTRFGHALALDGDTLAVGATGDANDGAVYVFTRQASGSWSEPVRLAAPTFGTDRELGRTLALAGDRLAVGAPGDDGDTFDGGAVYLFERSAGVWSEGKRLAPDVPQLAGWFGSSVTLDGRWLAAGATGEVSGNVTSGAAYVFEHDGTAFRQRARVTSLVPNDGQFFGDSVALADDTLVVGAFAASVNQPVSGAVYVYERGPGSWPELQRLAASNQSSYAYFGLRVAASTDLIVTGAHEDDSGGSGLDVDVSAGGLENSGTTYLFARRAGQFEQLTMLKAPAPGAYAYHGASVAFSAQTLVIGAPGESSAARGIDGDASDDSAPASGAAYVVR